MTLYEKIDLACRRGLHPIIKKGDKKGEKYCIVSPVQDRNGNYQMSYFEDSLEEAKRWICVTSLGCTKGRWLIIEREEGAVMLDEYYTPPIEPYEVGEKVFYMSKVWRVKEVDNEEFTYIIESETQSVPVRHEQLKPFFGEETNTAEKAEKTLEERVESLEDEFERINSVIKYLNKKHSMGEEKYSYAQKDINIMIPKNLLNT